MLVTALVNKRRPLRIVAHLLASAATVSGVGAVGWNSTGALHAQNSTVTGAGKSSSTGTGALHAQNSTVAGSGTSGTPTTSGSGALQAQNSTVAGAGVSKSTGTGVLTDQNATMMGSGSAAFATSYANTGGTGSRSGSVINIGSAKQPGGGKVADLIDGSTSNSFFFDSGDPTGNALSFDFGPTGNLQVIDEFRWKQNTTNTHGTWKLEGWNGTAWSDITTGISLGGTNGTQTVTCTNSTGYIVYRLTQTAGNISSTPFIQEIEFKITSGGAFTAASTSYANTGGTGNRTGTITATTTISVTGTFTNIIDGAFADNMFFGNVTGGEMKFDLGSAKVIDAFKLYQDVVVNADGRGHREWICRGSNDDSTYTDLGGYFILDGNSTGLEFQQLRNKNSYRYYKFIHLDGSTSNHPFLRELEFRIST